jgi:dihydroorotase
MLDHVAKGRLTIERFVDLTSHGPARLFQLAAKGRIASGYDADFTIVDLKAKRIITDGWIESRCGWTPYNDVEVQGWPVGTIIRGNIVMWQGEIGQGPLGRPLRFSDMSGDMARMERS